MAELVERFSAVRRSRPLMTFLNALLLYGVALAVAVVGGFISATGSVPFVAIFAAAAAAAAFVTSRQALLWFIIIGGLVITGAAQLYIPGSKYLRYIVPAAAVILLLHGALQKLSERKHAGDAGVASSPIMNWALVFVAVAVISSLINLLSAGVFIMGMKGYFQMWPFLLALALIAWNPRLIDTLPKLFLIIAICQLPFVLHQYFFLAPLRVGLGSGVVAVDVVAGTFGGTVFGGGANAVLALYMVIVVACLLAIWKRGALSGIAMLAAGIALLAPVFVNQAKVAAIYIPVAYVIIFSKEISEQPARFLGAGVVMMLLVGGLLTVFSTTNPGGGFDTLSEFFDFLFERQTAGIAARGDYSELSRWTALTFWAGEHVSENPAYWLIGHGPGSSRVQDGGLDLAITLAETRYAGLPLGYTGVSAILWDTGVLGLLAVFGMLLAGYRTARSLSSHYASTIPWKAGLFDGLAASMFVFAISLFHKDYFAFHLPYQTILVTVFGYLVVSQALVDRDDVVVDTQ